MDGKKPKFMNSLQKSKRKRILCIDKKSNSKTPLKLKKINLRLNKLKMKKKLELLKKPNKKAEPFQ